MVRVNKGGGVKDAKGGQALRETRSGSANKYKVAAEVGPRTLL